MRSILEELKVGNVDFVEAYKQCDELWGSILVNIDSLSVDDLAGTIASQQSSFERIMGDRYLGKTVMGWSGFSHLYSCSVGFEENGEKAYKLAQAFSKSYCSVEVKSTVRTAAIEYSVEEYA
jgi:hypothetical protein